MCNYGDMTYNAFNVTRYIYFELVNEKTFAK